MTHEEIISLSANALYLSFILYLFAIIPFGIAVKSQKNIYSYVGILLTSVGFICQLVYFISRWYVAGHAPVSNMYEFMTFFGIMLIAGFFILYIIYRQAVIGLFALPLALIVLGFANAFSSEISPLIPALQSNWLTIHVITVAFASAVLSISFVASVIYLLTVSDIKQSNKKTFSLEMLLFFFVVVCGFIISTTFFTVFGEEQVMTFQNSSGVEETYEYSMYPITVPNNAVAMNEELGTGLVSVPVTIDAHRLNTILWSFITGLLLYIIIRIVSRRSLVTLLKPLTKHVNPTLMDEIAHRAVVIGFPLFALGGLVFAMIWAQTAWTRFWGWDPKEVWALITFLLYAAYLHLRLNRKWAGEKAAWISIIGFGTIIFNQVFVNLVIAGLHSYAL